MTNSNKAASDGVYILGVGQVPVSKETAASGQHLAAQAIGLALADAGLATDRIDALYVGNMMSGTLSQQQQLAALVAECSGMSGTEAFTIEAACASGGAATRLAYQTVAGGVNSVVVVCGVELMTHVTRTAVTQALTAATDWQVEGAQGANFPILNARVMAAYMDAYGVSAEHFAPFAVAAHSNAATNPNAVLRKPIDVDTYMQSREIINPIRLYDCSPLCNGAAAAVLASGQVARSLEGRDRPLVKIAGSGAATAPLALSRRRSLLELDAISASTAKAFRQAGITHGDVDLFELHDAYTVVTALSLEASGFAKPGTGTRFGTEGRIGLTGDLPIATMGGLKARGHPVGATGTYQLVEAFLQLAGRAGPNQVRDPEVALIQNLGGIASTVVTHVLARER
jgi:acetyl-CoA C-acetyltransferase